MMAGLDILNGFVSKVISDCIDISINAIKKADRNRKSKNQTLQTRIYQVTVDALNVFPYNKYKKNEKVYDAAECILKELKKGNSDYKESVRMGLNMISLEVTGDKCEEFLGLLHDEICREENRDLAIEHIVHQGERINEQQQQMDRYMQEAFEENRKYEKEILEEVCGVKFLIKEMNGEKGYKTDNKIPIVNRVNEYADRWNENVFLNNFNEEDENAGVNIKLEDIYRIECLPHYIWKTNTEPSNELEKLLMKYINKINGKKMLLILGQPGIGKSTLITWIMANLVEKREDILVYQFANDLGSINWQSENILNDIFGVMGLEYDKLENKILILDGFDEIYVGEDRERILNKLQQELKRRNVLINFSLIITCRQNYIYNMRNIECDYITLQEWNQAQIDIFCRAYWETCESMISEVKIQKILEKEHIFGIPLILYMILALDITIEKSSSIVDIFDQIFSLKKGGIYDRCYDAEHRINKPEIKRNIHQVSQKIAFWIFENNNDKAFIYQKNFKEICEIVVSEANDKSEEIQSDTLIGSYFKIKYCEGVGTDELQFVHRSIYEYFVATFFFESINKLTSKEEVAGKLGELLKDGHLTIQMCEFIKYKFSCMKEYYISDMIKKIFRMMLKDGMSYYMKGKYKDIVVREMNIFSNMLEIVHLWNHRLEDVDSKIAYYLNYNHLYMLNLKGTILRGAHLRRVNLAGADLSGADLIGADLIGADLREANLRGAILSGVDLVGADLVGADLSGADLSGAYLIGANLIGTDVYGVYFRGVKIERANLNGIHLGETDLNGANLNEVVFDEEQVKWLCEKYELKNSRVYLFETREIISYKEYLIRN